MPFCEAAKLYIALRSFSADNAYFIRENTQTDYANNLKSAEMFFGSTRLCDIGWRDMRRYQRARASGGKEFLRYRRPQDAKPRIIDGIQYPAKGKTSYPVKPQQIRQELRLVRKLKILSDTWTPEDNRYFEHLHSLEDDVDRALTPDQQRHWLETSALTPRWETVLWWSRASFDLLTSPGELRGLQLGHVNLAYQLVRIPWPCAKNPYRMREIPIESATCLEALENFVKRARDKGAKTPTDHLFPFHHPRRPDPDPKRPMTSSGLKRLWQEVREATDLKWFRMEDTRHTGATRMAEAGYPVQIIAARMGHCDEKKQRHYTHISQQAQRLWLRSQEQNLPRIPPASVHSWAVQNFFEKSS